MCNKIIELEGLAVSAEAYCVCKASAVPQDLTVHPASKSRSLLMVTERGTSSQGVDGAVISRGLKDIIAFTFSSSFLAIQEKGERLTLLILA